MVALGIRKLSARQRSSGCLVVCYGSRCEDRVCPAILLWYDHFSAIRSVFDAPPPLSRERWWGSGEYNSILITLVRMTLHHLTFFIFSPVSLRDLAWRSEKMDGGLGNCDGWYCYEEALCMAVDVGHNARRISRGRFRGQATRRMKLKHGLIFRELYALRS